MDESYKRLFRIADEEIDYARKNAIRADIAQRLRRICSDLTDDEFQMLVEQMADRQLKSERKGFPISRT